MQETTHTQISSPLVGAFGRVRARLVREDGQALVEFAIVATVLLFIVIGILYFGRFLGYDLDQTHLANVGARWAAVSQDPGCVAGGTCTPLYSYIQSLAPGELGSGSSDVKQATVCVKLLPDATGTLGAQGGPVQVTVITNYHFLPFLQVANTLVTQTAVMRLEAPMATSNTQFVGSVGPLTSSCP